MSGTSLSMNSSLNQAHRVASDRSQIRLASVLLLTASASASSAELVPQDVQTEIDALRRDIAELRDQGIGGAAWLSEERAADIRAIVRDVMSDSATRDSLQESTATAGWKDGFFISSADGNYTMRINGYMQERYTYDRRKSLNGLSGAQELEWWGEETRRLKMAVEGNLIDPSWKYKVEIANLSGLLTVDDAWLEKNLEDGVSVKIGQFKTPFLRENLIGDAFSMMVDRSSVEAFFGNGRSLSAQVNWLKGDIQLTAAYLNGFVVKSNYFSSGIMQNTEFPSERVADYAFAARAEWKVAGEWKQFKDPAGWPSNEFGMMFGLAGEVEQKGNNQGVPASYAALGAVDPFVVAVTIDANIEWSGASILTYGVWRQVDTNISTLEASNQFGFMFQAGYFITDNVELVARYEYGDADANLNGAPPVLNTLNNNGYETLNAVGVGANWFISKQRVKLAADVCYALEGIGAFQNAGNGFLPDGTSSSGEFNQGGQVMGRMQLQVMW